MADPTNVLTQQAAKIRAVIDGLIGEVKATQRWNTGNRRMACQTPADNPWPALWNYVWTLQVNDADTRPLARQFAADLQSQGWTQETSRDADGYLRLRLQRDGSVINLDSMSTGGRVGLSGSTACVNADGTMDRSQVP